MSDQQVDPGQEVVDRIADAGGIEGVIEPAQPADTGTETPAEQSDDFYLGKYKTREEAQRGLTEAERKMHEASQRAADLERQLQEFQQPQEASPFGMLGPQDEDLFQMASENPGMAYYNSLAFADQLGWKAPQIQKQLLQYWMSVDPQEALAYEWQRLQAANQPDEPDAPDLATTHAMQQIMNNAGGRALADYPWLKQYEAQIMERISPDDLAKALQAQDPAGAVYDLVIDRAAAIHLRATRAQPAAEQAAAPAGAARVATQRRNGAPPADASPEARLKQAILNVPDRGIDFTKTQ